uniref:Uncharacterized protein n=1 Tax=Pseudomonas syringae pv. cerasicola TaxID=264451 RepID=A0A330K3S9_PSESX|nr:hypothetical protein PSCFBP6110_P300105 [Pseudomonas syringae pv. cerasicola]
MLHSDLNFSLVLCPDTLYLADTDPGQPCSFRNATSTAFKSDDPFMHFGIRFTPSVSTGALGQVDALALSLSPVLEVVTRYLQGHTQQHVLYALQHHLGDTTGRLGQFR